MAVDTAVMEAVQVRWRKQNSLNGSCPPDCHYDFQCNPELLIGRGVGLALGLALRCPGNTCPITSNWWVMAAIGAILGLGWRA